MGNVDLKKSVARTTDKEEPTVLLVSQAKKLYDEMINKCSFGDNLDNEDDVNKSSFELVKSKGYLFW